MYGLVHTDSGPKVLPCDTEATLKELFAASRSSSVPLDANGNGLADQAVARPPQSGDDDQVVGREPSASSTSLFLSLLFFHVVFC